MHILSQPLTLPHASQIAEHYKEHLPYYCVVSSPLHQKLGYTLNSLLSMGHVGSGLFFV